MFITPEIFATGVFKNNDKNILTWVPVFQKIFRALLC